MSTRIDQASQSSWGSATATAQGTTRRTQSRGESQIFQRLMTTSPKAEGGTTPRFRWPGAMVEYWSAKASAATDSSATVSQRTTTEVQNETPSSKVESAAAAESEHEGLSKLRDLLKQNGISADDVTLRYVEEEVWCPMVRAWVNKTIVAECGNGRRLAFDADLTARSPSVTLNSINDMLNGWGNTGVDETVPA